MAGKILILTNDTFHAKFLEECLSSIRGGLFATGSASQLSTALTRLETGHIDIVLTDLTLHDSQGMEIIDRLSACAPDIPIIIFTTSDEEPIAIEALQRGAQSYLTKGHSNCAFIARLIDNILARKEIEESLFLEKTRAETTLDSISDSVIITDIKGNVDYLNQAAERMTGWSKKEARGRAINEVMTIIHSTHHQSGVNPAEQVLQTGAPASLESGAVLRRRDGVETIIEDYAAPVHDSTGKLSGAVVVFHDISASKAMTERMAYLAQHDFLTELPNRLLLHDRISQAIQLASRRGTTLGILFLDLDNFKTINDSLGHDVGDKLLYAFAGRLRSCVRSSDTVSRIGGDEFIILLGDDATNNTATVARKILKAIAEPFLIDGLDLHVTTSIGISLYPAHGRDAETLIKKADMAMYQIKCRGGNNYHFYDDAMTGYTAMKSDGVPGLPHKFRLK